VRTLHHDDSISLLVPRIRTDAGYRLDTDADLLHCSRFSSAESSAYHSRRSDNRSMTPASTGGSGWSTNGSA
jgi:hypothetical protein